MRFSIGDIVKLTRLPEEYTPERAWIINDGLIENGYYKIRDLSSGAGILLEGYRLIHNTCWFTRVTTKEPIKVYGIVTFLEEMKNVK